MAGTPMLDEFEKWMTVRDGDEEYIKEVYLTGTGKCVPDQYIGDDLALDIRRKFALPLNFIIEKVQAELGVKGNGLWLYPLIDADYEGDTTYTMVVMNHNTGRRDFLYYDSNDARRYWFETREDFEKELFDIYVEVHKNLTRLGVGA